MIYRSRVRVYDDTPPIEIALPRDLQEYAELWNHLKSLSGDDFVIQMRTWILADQFFLLRYVMSAGTCAWDSFRNEAHFDHPVHIKMARTLQFDPDINDVVLIGARALGKSSHLYADDIRTVLADANFSIFIFSLTRELATKHLSVILSEFEQNKLLKAVFPDRLWQTEEERRAAGHIAWSLGKGICLKRTTTRPEQTIEAHAFEVMLPTGMHPDRRHYDDIEADRAVSSEWTAATIEERWRSSQDITSSRRERRVGGTIYAPDALMVRLSREYGMRQVTFPGEDTRDPVPPEIGGPLGGRPVNGFTREHLWVRCKDAGGAEKDEMGGWRRTNNQAGLVNYARQTACDPMAGEATRLDWRWIRFYDGDPERLPGLRTGHVVVCCDCSTGRTLDADPTWLWAWLLTPDREFWWIDSERRVVKPAERRRLIHDFVSKWQNLGGKVVQVRIEQHGQATYVEDQIEFWQNLPRFDAPPILKCSDNKSPKNGQGKEWAIYERWEANASSGKVRFPHQLIRLDDRGVPVDLVHYLKTWEWEMFPRSKTDDGLDAGKLIWEREKLAGEIPWPPDSWETGTKESYRKAASSSQSAGIC